MSLTFVFGDLARKLYDDIEGNMIGDHDELIKKLREWAKKDGWIEETIFEDEKGDVAIVFYDPEAGVVFLMKKGTDLYLVDINDLMEIINVLHGFIKSMFKRYTGWPAIL